MTDLAEDTDADAPAASGRRPTLTLDVALYNRYLEDSALSDDDRRALLEALWAVIVGFVDLGFAVEPAAVREEELQGRNEELALSLPALIDYSAIATTDHFEQAASLNRSPDH